MSHITGTAAVSGVRVEVFAGGALSSLSLTDSALRLGGPRLAEAVLDAVREATAVANQRTRHALALGDADSAALGLAQDATRTERAEATTPESWRQV